MYDCTLRAFVRVQSEGQKGENEWSLQTGHLEIVMSRRDLLYKPKVAMERWEQFRALTLLPIPSGALCIHNFLIFERPPKDPSRSRYETIRPKMGHFSHVRGPLFVALKVDFMHNLCFNIHSLGIIVVSYRQYSQVHNGRSPATHFFS